SEGNRGDDSLLARERELRELPAEIEAATAVAQRAASTCGEVSQEIERVRVEIEHQQGELAELARRDRQQRQQMEDLRRRVDRSRQAHRWHREQLERTEAELNTLAANAQRLAAQLGELQQTETASNEQLSRKEAEVNAAGADNLLQELANRRAAAAEVQGHLRSQHALLESTGRTLQSVTDQIAHKEALEQQLASEIEVLAAQTEELSRREHALSSQLSALQDEIQPLEAELARLEAQQAGAENQERQLQQTLRKDESAWNQAQLHLQRSEDQLHQLRNEIEQDLGLVALEASDDVAYQPPLPWDAFVQQLPVLEGIPESLGDEVREMRARLARLSNVNPEAPREYEEAATRYEFLYTQAEDLEAAAADLQKVIKELDERMEVELRRTYEAVGKEFTRFFQLLFNGGTAHLELTDPENISTSGVEIIARPPGKRPQSLALLSGGERSLAACALIFAILHVSPTPFCVLDEVDAALDEANVDRFRATLEDLSGDTQFIVVTHNRRTLEGANTIYGVTMGNDGISRVISLRLEGDRMVKHEESPDTGSGDAADLKALEEEIKL
ncbi:MAG: AAA family ATPase, partial [Caldilineaceae bacterium]|nr:AAA family ATPase [Caldilineaceae bacterium]